MKKTTLRIAVLSLLAAVLASAPSPSLAQEKKKDKPAAEKKEPVKSEKKEGRIPFTGKVAAVDKNAMTITVGERVFQVGSETRLMKGGKPATLGDAVVGEEIGGSYQKGENGKLNAKMIRLGPKPETEPKGEAKKGEGKKKKTE